MKKINSICRPVVLAGVLSLAAGLSAPVAILRAQPSEDAGQRLFRAHQDCVCQIQVLDLASGKKSSIGSGFQFTAAGHLATNFHVVADAVHKPELYRITAVRPDGPPRPVTVLAVDVVHDLAVLQTDTPGPAFLRLGSSQMENGARIFSFGNPFDLGLSIVDGAYNGLMENSLYQKILFSGSLNPGMSGGPAVNHDGEVVGVNVATQGNEISFLVPVEELQALYQRALAPPDGPASGWSEQIERQLLGNQDRYMDQILAAAWEPLSMGPAAVPGEMTPAFKCWGDSWYRDRDWLDGSFVQCSTDDEIYVSSELSTGMIFYRYVWLTAKGNNPVRFYNEYERIFSQVDGYPNAGEDEAGNFDCTAGFVDLSGHDFKVTFCARRYKRYDKLYDINLSLASVDQGNAGLGAELVALGLSRENIDRFIQSFLRGIRWPE